jgi:hypothetical protein
VPYFVVQDFRGGLDRRRLAVTAAPGTLRTLRNAHVNRGGEIEKRKAFVPWVVLPSGTYGMASLGDNIYVFGSALSVSVPGGMVYQRLPHPGGSAMTQVLAAHAFASKLYVVARYQDNSIRHFYDGVEVTVFTNRTAAQSAQILLPFKNKMYAGAAGGFYGSKLADPTDWSDTATGSLFIDMTAEAAGFDAITGLGNYLNSLAVFSRRTIQIWTLSADPAQSLQSQVLRNLGTVAPNSVESFADSDVFFLHDSGIRSLRARDSSNSAAVNDVGTPIDDDVIAAMRTLGTATFAAHSVIEPEDGRFWLALGQTAYVFSYFPAAKIAAWSTYDMPAVSDTLVAHNQRVHMRAGNTVYIYGGFSGAEYDATEAEAELSFLDGRQIATWKNWRSFDLAAEGTWQVSVAYDPEQPNAEDLLATVTGSTIHQMTFPMLGIGPMAKLRLLSQGSGAAKIGTLAVHYDAVAAR